MSEKQLIRMAKGSNVNYLKFVRMVHNMTQQQLADKVGCTRQTINLIENGKYRVSNENSLVLEKIAKYFEFDSVESMFHQLVKKN